MRYLAKSATVLHMGKPRTQVTDGEELRRLRYLRGYSIKEVINKLQTEHGIEFHPDSLRCIELGYRNPGPKVFAALARIYKVDPATLYRASQ